MCAVVLWSGSNSQTDVPQVQEAQTTEALTAGNAELNLKKPRIFKWQKGCFRLEKGDGGGLAGLGGGEGGGLMEMKERRRRLMEVPRGRMVHLQARREAASSRGSGRSGAAAPLIQAFNQT